jgi:hypothetical protein
MGIVKKILALKNVAPVSTMYSDHASMELAESFHLHWRNCRFVMDDEEFRSFLELVNEAQGSWKQRGSPPAHANGTRGDQEILAKKTIKEHPGSANPYIANEGMRVELIQWADFIHVHWKWVRLEFDYREFLEFADTIAAAAGELRQAHWFESAPRRLGTHHVASPRGRVDKPDDENFWTQSAQTLTLDDRHRTIFLEDSDADRVGLPNARVQPDEPGRPQRTDRRARGGAVARARALVRSLKHKAARWLSR